MIQKLKVSILSVLTILILSMMPVGAEDNLAKHTIHPEGPAKFSTMDLTASKHTIHPEGSTSVSFNPYL